MDKTQMKQPWGFCETPHEKCTMNYCDDNGCLNRSRCLVDDGVTEMSKGLAKQSDTYVLDVLKRNYPDLDTNDVDAVTELIRKENLQLHYSDVDLQFNGNTVKAQQVVRIFKELR